MKKELLLMCKLLFVALFFSAPIFAQRGASHPTLVSDPLPMASIFENRDASSRTTACVDTIGYPVLKEYLLGDTIFYTFGLWQADAEAVSQTYLLSGGGSMSVTGVEFISRVSASSTPSTVSLAIAICSVDASNNPTSILGTATTTISHTTLAYSYVNFATPISVSSNYAIVLTPLSTDGVVDLYFNDFAPGQTQDENLSRFTSTYSGYGSAGDWVNLTTLDIDGDGTPYDAEPALHPIVSYDVTSSFTASDLTACVGTPVTFTSTSTPASALSSRMFSFLEIC